MYERHVRLLPIYIMAIRPKKAKKLSTAIALNGQRQRYEDLRTVPERLRYCRQQKELLQREVAEKNGVTKAVYADLEQNKTDVYDPAVMDKLATLYQVPVSDLTDGYNRFLQSGQGQVIRNLRASLGLSYEQLAERLHTSVRNIRVWESEKKCVSKEMWEKCFQKLVLPRIL